MASVTEKIITVLSVDGGGVRGIIPGVCLDYLESQLQVNNIAYLYIRMQISI